MSARPLKIRVEISAFLSDGVRKTSLGRTVTRERDIDAELLREFEGGSREKRRAGRALIRELLLDLVRRAFGVDAGLNDWPEKTIRAVRRFPQNVEKCGDNRRGRCGKDR